MAGYQGTSTRENDGEAFAALVESERRDIHTSLPGKAVSYNGKTVAIKPSLTQTFGNKTLAAPTLESIPVLHPQGGGFIIHTPVASGDGMTLFFASRARDSFQGNGGDMSNAPGRMHDMTDAVAFPGGAPDNVTTSGIDPTHCFIGSTDGKRGMNTTPGGDIALRGGPSGTDKIVVTPDGKVDMRAENGESLMQLMKETLELIRDHLTKGTPMDAPYQIRAQELLNRLGGMRA